MRGEVADRVRSRVNVLRSRVRPRARIKRAIGALVGPPVGATAQSDSPADFGRWLERIVGRGVSRFPDQWSLREDMPILGPSRVVAVVHVFFPELLDEIIEHLASIPVAFDILVTNASGAAVSIDPSRLPRARHIRVLNVVNRGRDILPLVALVNAGYLDPYELVVKVHTKRSDWRDDHELSGSGGQWRAGLLNSLLGSPEQVTGILDAFAGRPDLGMITGDGSVLGPDYWGDNQVNVATLLRRLELGLDEGSLRFVAGSVYWARGFVVQGLRALNLSVEDFEPEAGQVNATTAHAIERILGILAIEAGLRVEDVATAGSAAFESGQGSRFDLDSPRRPRARVFPFFLPQFHPIPENDRWWGKGFTEWTNVAAARPVYLGHHQPKIPRDLGFYDLRTPGIALQQEQLARAHGLEGFMYYYYWFAGRRLLEGPIKRMLDSDTDTPFSIMWANENWTRRWDGQSQDVLIGQDYEAVPARFFIEDVLPFLLDPRYVRINGKCLLSVYRPGQLPDFAEVLDAWRATARLHGIELHVVTVDVPGSMNALTTSATSVGLDGVMGFPPHNCHWSHINRAGLAVDPRFTGHLLGYRELVREAERDTRTGLAEGSFPAVMVTFDNTARRQMAGDVWFGSNPYTFRRWLATCVKAVSHRDEQNRVVFVNAWNEWAEGAVLEPSDRFGATYLLACRDVLFG
ncbi:MAG: glycoside hydrolase family 99-like domain-containing protein [Candidatus Phosphoribacter sp.]